MNSKTFQTLIVILALLLPGAPASPALSGGGWAQDEVPPLPEAAESTGELPAGVQADWWGTVQKNILSSEYNVTWQEQTYLPDAPAAYQAPNRANNLRTYFTPQNVALIPREWDETQTAPPWRWTLQLASWGLETAMQPAAEAEMLVGEAAADSRSVEYRRPGLVEAFRNTEDGLEQSFTIQAPPQGAIPTGQMGSTVVAVGFAGDLQARLVQDENSIELLDANGQPALRYALISVTGADGQALAGRLELTPSGAAVILEAQAAQHVQHPIRILLRIDGLSTYWDWRFESDLANTSFGESVYTAGDVDGDDYSDVIVGAPFYDGGQTNEGRAYVFLGSASGLEASAAWTKESNQAEALFGSAVSTAGDVNGDGYADIIVGARRWDDDYTDEGGAWIYHGSAGGPSTTPNRYLKGGQESAYFGIAVGFAGNVNGDAYSDIIVGASFYTNGAEAHEGVVRVWHGSASGIGAAYNWQAQSNQNDAHLGNSVSTAGDVNGDSYADIIAGAPGYNNGAADEGMAVAWYGSINGVNNDVDGTPANADWLVEGYDADAAMFGTDVSLAGDVNGDGYGDVIVGAPYYTNGQADEGGAWTFHGSASGLSTTASTHDEGNQAGAHFGTAVGAAGDVNGDGYADVIVGAPYYDDSETDEGKVWVWHGSASGLSASNDWNSRINQADAHYGLSAAPAGDVNGDGYSDVIIGIPGYDNGQTDEGAVYVFYGSPAALSESADWTKRSNQENGYFGWSVSTAGDVNGDGYADIIVGMPYWDSGVTNDGGAWVYHGSAGGVISAPAWYKAGGQEAGLFGYSVSTAGDVNGDGYSDIIVGEPYWDHGHTDEGGIFVYHGSSSGLSTSPDWSKDSDHVDALFGFSVSTAGDINGDGYSDVIAGTPAYTADGAAFAYIGSASGLDTAPFWAAYGGDTDGQFGYSVSTAGDVNRDGLSDVIVGAPYWDDSEVNEGRASVYLGSAGVMSGTPVWHAESNLANANMGWSVNTAGDVNGDGYADIIVGAPHFGDGGLTSEGKVWVFHGSAGGPNAAATWSRESGQNGAYYGYSVSTAGDVNGDGYADVILGAPLMNDGVADEGAARLYCGSATGLDATYDWGASGGQTLAWYGISVSNAGDVNGDGYADVIVGAKDYTDVVTNEGMAFVYYGNASAGVNLQPRQTRLTSDTPIAPLGRSNKPNGFRVYTRQWTPFGRIGLSHQIEAKRIGQLFNGSGTVWWGYYAKPVPGADTHTSISSLTPHTSYHWRVRILYDPIDNPFMPASHWFTQPWNGWNETDFRLLGGEVFLPLTMEP